MLSLNKKRGSISKLAEEDELEPGHYEIPKESISLTAVLIFLGSIFLLLVIMLFYLRFSSWSPFSDYFSKKKLPNYSLIDLFNKEKSNSPTLQTVEIKITEDDLSKSIGVSEGSFPLKKSSLKIKPEGIIISGKTSSGFWGVPVDVLFESKVGGGKLTFNLKEIKAAGVVAPPKISNTLTPKMSSIFYQGFSSLDKLKVKEARTLVGYMIVEVEK
jgi:hypothetical protein